MTERWLNHRKRNAESMLRRGTNQAYRMQENERSAEVMATRHTN
jgi:hypothetical protein